MLHHILQLMSVCSLLWHVFLGRRTAVGQADLSEFMLCGYYVSSVTELEIKASV